MSDKEAVTPSDSRPSPSPPPPGTGEERGSSPIHQQQADYKLVWVEKDPDKGESIESKNDTVAAPSSPLLSYLPPESSRETVDESLSQSQSQNSIPESKSETENSEALKSETEDVLKSESQISVPEITDEKSKRNTSKCETDSHDPVPETRASKPEPLPKTDSADKPSETTPTLPSSPGPTPSPTGSLTSPLSPVPPPSVPCILFEGVHYLGSSTVDAPVSENEANRKMTILKEQAAQSIPVTLSIPDNNTGILHTFYTCTYMACIHVLVLRGGESTSTLIYPLLLVYTIVFKMQKN